MLIQGCTSTTSKITNIQVLEKGADSSIAFCKDFSLTSKQAIDFFKRSREVEINEFHNNYEYLPCYVKGTLNKNNKECKFTIRAGGTAELTCNDKTGYLYVCDSCDHILRDNE